MNNNSNKTKEIFDNIVNRLQSIIDKGDYEKFLKFQKSFKGYSFNNLVLIFSQFPDATRVAGEYSTYCIDSAKEHHNYKCGLEVLLDVYTLARCNSLIAGLSHVSFAARVVKMAYGEVYEEMRLLDVGINRNNKIPPTEKETILS